MSPIETCLVRRHEREPVAAGGVGCGVFCPIHDGWQHDGDPAQKHGQPQIHCGRNVRYAWFGAHPNERAVHCARIAPTQDQTYRHQPGTAMGCPCSRPPQWMAAYCPYCYCASE